MTQTQNQFPAQEPSLGLDSKLPISTYSDSASPMQSGLDSKLPISTYSDSASPMQSAASVVQVSKNRRDDSSGTAVSPVSGASAASASQPGRRSSQMERLATHSGRQGSEQPPSLSNRTSSEYSCPPELDPSFASWKFILDGGKKHPIGRGGFGKVYKVLTDKLQTVAVKIVKLNDTKNPTKLAKAIERERLGIEILKGIRHLNIMQFLKYERSSTGQFCIFTELIAGHSLLDLMNLQGRPFDEEAVKKISVQVCTALNFLHNWTRPVVHRDIKCSNIMLTHEGVVKLIDFGLAKQIVSTFMEVSTDHLGGTWYYMAPELFRDDGRITYSPKTDVWAFGCAVFEMLEMKPPNGEVCVHLIPVRICHREMPELPARTSSSLKDFYRRCVERDAAMRADTADLLRHGFLAD
uniref:Protein kinase domain-containing protein n=1 Tax=Macrostomum lignano TaxID=282301 RepID=A0A1I8GQT6_9PLAT